MLASFDQARTRLFGSARLGFREVDWAEVVSDARRYALELGLKLTDLTEAEETRPIASN